MTKRQFLAIMYLLTGVIPLIAQTFTEQKKSYHVSTDRSEEHTSELQTQSLISYAVFS